MTTIFDYNNGLHLNIIKNINPTTKKPEHIIEYSYDTQYQNCIIVIFFKQQLFDQIFISTYVAKQKYTYKCTKLDAQQTTQTSDFYVTYIYNCLNKNNAEAYAKTLVANMGKFTIHVDKGLFYSHRTKKGLAIFYNSTDKKLKVIVSGAVFTIDKGQTLERKFSYAPSITSVYPHNKEMLTYNEMGVPTDYLPMEINSTVPRMINRHTSFKWKKKTDFIPVHMELVYINSYKKSEILLRDECTSTEYSVDIPTFKDKYMPHMVLGKINGDFTYFPVYKGGYIYYYPEVVSGSTRSKYQHCSESESSEDSSEDHEYSDDLFERAEI